MEQGAEEARRQKGLETSSAKSHLGHSVIELGFIYHLLTGRVRLQFHLEVTSKSGKKTVQRVTCHHFKKKVWLLTFDARVRNSWQHFVVIHPLAFELDRRRGVVISVARATLMLSKH